MKYWFFALFLLVSISFSAQTINQFDDNGKRHGIWKKNFDGTKVLRYEGQFNHGKEIGTFNFYKNIRNKAVLTASKVFNESSTTANVTFYTSKGKVISEGKMDGKTYIGTWKYYHSNSDKLMTIEHYNNNGNLEGERLVYYDNGQMAEKQNYINGKLNGESFWYSVKNGVLKHFQYENGELHGISRYYTPRGDLKAEGRYKRDKKHGVWKYYENGKLINEKDFTPKSKYKIKKAP
ncbi:toxin-antitoxin system YwqK family antitoxin [Seonamhaeicola marinus]|uniref:Toxin-antitoxin system YwqK family antitoxin n=1 Tax=Seonamhaeicola marinus TaxID=1912246 RepID=A0A5D0HJI8_9FLAO|nr:toxin-antitoxin system YwqK family antitoxin [Seonamhaeicola marinus]TYA71554.1 toxin-antitoxin system YwqK family antitoxin [Seonamhaeicola marinus]